jgi:hypothetical protein
MSDREHELPEEIAQRIVTMVVLTEPGADLRLKRKIATAIRQAYEGMDRLEAERDEADRRAGAAERELADLKCRKMKAGMWMDDPKAAAEAMTALLEKRERDIA